MNWVLLQPSTCCSRWDFLPCNGVKSLNQQEELLSKQKLLCYMHSISPSKTTNHQDIQENLPYSAPFYPFIVTVKIDTDDTDKDPLTHELIQAVICALVSWIPAIMSVMIDQGWMISYMEVSSLIEWHYITVMVYGFVRSRAWTTKRVCQQGAQCCTAWRTLPPSWRLSPWTLPATCGQPSATSSRPSSQNFPLCFLSR